MPLTYDFTPDLQPRATGIGEMWWARTDWSWPGSGNGTTSTMDLKHPDDGLHMSGRLRRQDGDLWKGSILVLAQFVLSTNRMPPGGAGRFTSQPTCTFAGPMTGFTGDYWGDNWSKCWMHTSQVIRGGPGGGIIGEGHEPRTLIHLSQDDERVNISLPGFLRFPRVDFKLNPSHTVTTTLAVRLDFQLEGIAGLAFGRTSGTELVPGDAVLALSQWIVQRL